MVMVLAVTPGYVAPPLTPFGAATHGGAYTDGILIRPVFGSQFGPKCCSASVPSCLASWYVIGRLGSRSAALAGGPGTAVLRLCVSWPLDARAATNPRATTMATSGPNRRTGPTRGTGVAVLGVIKR